MKVVFDEDYIEELCKREAENLRAFGEKCADGATYLKKAVYARTRVDGDISQGGVVVEVSI